MEVEKTTVTKKIWNTFGVDSSRKKIRNMELNGTEELKKCQDCATEPFFPHKEGCDTELCSVCGGQRLGCDCEGHDPLFSRWTGIWPGSAEAAYLRTDLNHLSVKFHIKAESI